LKGLQEGLAIRMKLTISWANNILHSKADKGKRMLSSLKKKSYAKTKFTPCFFYFR